MKASTFTLRDGSVFDSMTFRDVSDFIETTSESYLDPRNAQDQHYLRTGFVGRSFSSMTAVWDAIFEKWEHGEKLLDDMESEIADCQLPSPINRRRRRSFNEWDGDDVDYDRLRSAQHWWTKRTRQLSAGPTEFAIVVNVATPGKVSPDNIFWRSAAALAVAKSLELSGYRVEMFVVELGKNVYQVEEGSRPGVKPGTAIGNAIAVQVKRPFDPLDRTGLTNLMSGWCYRTAWFAAICNRHLDELPGVVHVNGTLGQAIDMTEDIVRPLIDREMASTGLLLFDRNIESRERAIEAARQAIEDIGTED